MTLHIVILAAGKGKRMQSALPKVLHSLAGKPILQHLVDTAKQLNPAAVHIVIGHQGAQIQQAFTELPVKWVEQPQQLGTGNALGMALPGISEEAQVLVLVGDMPLISLATIQRLLQATPQQGLGLVTADVANPAGLGRIIRNSQQQISKIVEHLDATPEQLAITEINSGILLSTAANFRRWLAQVTNNNAQQEYYLTDVIPLALHDQCIVTSVLASNEQEVQGINDRAQLIQLERYYQRQQAQKFLLAGVTIVDPQRFDVRGEASIACDVVIDVNVILEGRVIIGNDCQIGPNCSLRNVKLGSGVQIRANSVLEDAEIGDQCIIGPFARIRPGTKLAEKVCIGNFVEIKKAQIGAATKINHLTYIGDASIGKFVNIGAGTITCNYDGVNKHHTTIGDYAFIGSGAQLVAPLTIGLGATIGAGSTITKNAPDEILTLSRAKQQSIPGWTRPTKKTDQEV